MSTTYEYSKNPNFNSYSNELYDSSKDNNLVNFDSNYELGQSIEKYKMKIMEKDKTLFEYSKNLKENEKVIESLQREFNIKEEENQKLKDQLQSLQLELKHFEMMLNKKKDEVNNIQNDSNKELSKLENDNQNLIREIDNLKKIIDNQEASIKVSSNEYQNSEKNNINLKLALDERNSVILKYENIFNQLKNDNKQIPALKIKVTEMESIIINLKNSVNTLKEKNDKLNFEKKTLEEQFNNFLSENQKEKINERNLFRLNLQIENMKKELNNKENEIINLSEKYKSNIKDGDNFVHIVTSELGNFTNYLEGLNMDTKTLMKIPINNFNKLNSNNLNPSFSLKYEVMNKSIDLLKNKVIDILNSNLDTINKLNNSNNDLEIIQLKNSFQETSQKNEQISKDTSKFMTTLKDKLMSLMNRKSIPNTTNMSREQYNNFNNYDSNNNLNNFDNTMNNNMYNNSNYVNNSNNFRNSERNFNNSSEFDNNYNDEYSQNYYEGQQDNINFQNNLIEKIDSLIQENENLQKDFNYLEEKYNINEEELNKLKKDNDYLTKQMENITKNADNKVSDITLSKDTEIKQQKTIFYEKIKSLTQLLEESNQLIQSYENEVKDLKNKNSKLEYNLKMLTQSHFELEKIVNHSTDGLRTEIDVKDQRYNELLKEIQLKDLHIQSLEKLLGQEQNNDLVNKNPIPISNNNFDNNNIFSQSTQSFSKQGTSFIKDEEIERGLNKMIDNFNNNDYNNMIQSQNNENTNFQTFNNYTNQNENDIINMGNNQSIKNSFNKKVPGKIYSTKNNI